MADDGNNGAKSTTAVAQTKTFEVTKFPPVVGSPTTKSPLGVVRLMDQAGIPREFITYAKDFQEAVAKTTFLDDNQLNDVIAYYSQLREQELWEEIGDLTCWLNGRPAIGGQNRLLALMAHTGIISPDLLDRRLSKEGEERLQKAHEARDRQRQGQNQGGNGG